MIKCWEGNRKISQRTTEEATLPGREDKKSLCEAMTLTWGMRISSPRQRRRKAFLAVLLASTGLGIEGLGIGLRDRREDRMAKT